jgi:hypothetical protein
MTETENLDLLMERCQKISILLKIATGLLLQIAESKDTALISDENFKHSIREIKENIDKLSL